jgi:hypothetical protein
MLLLDLGFVSLSLDLSEADVKVHATDGRLLFSAIGAGRIAPFDLIETKACLPWEDTDSIRLGIAQAIAEARGFRTATREGHVGRAGSAQGAFFLPRARLARSTDRFEGNPS